MWVVSNWCPEGSVVRFYSPLYFIIGSFISNLFPLAFTVEGVVVFLLTTWSIMKPFTKTTLLLGVSLILSPQGLCTVTAAFLHFFFLASFCWVLTEAWQSYLAVIGKIRPRLIRKRFLCLGWGKRPHTRVVLPRQAVASVLSLQFIWTSSAQVETWKIKLELFTHKSSPVSCFSFFSELFINLQSCLDIRNLFIQ